MQCQGHGSGIPITACCVVQAAGVLPESGSAKALADASEDLMQSLDSLLDSLQSPEPGHSSSAAHSSAHTATDHPLIPERADAGSTAEPAKLEPDGIAQAGPAGQQVSAPKSAGYIGRSCCMVCHISMHMSWVHMLNYYVLFVCQTPYFNAVCLHRQMSQVCERLLKRIYLLSNSTLSSTKRYQHEAVHLHSIK